MRRTKKIVIAALAATGVAAGIGLSTTVALGDTSPSPSATSEQDAPGDDNGGDNGLHFTSSVTAPETDTADETGEAAALLPLARIDAATAEANALAQVPGTASEVQLENADGNVVWTVQVLDSAGLHTTVFIDAGNGSVLATKAHPNEGADGPDDSTDTD